MTSVLTKEEKFMNDQEMLLFNLMNQEIKEHMIFKKQGFRTTYHALLQSKEGIFRQRPENFCPDFAGKVYTRDYEPIYFMLAHKREIKSNQNGWA